jgi:predicted kinase
MFDKTLILTVGLPRSGKSTWALDQAMQHGHVIVSPDSIRLALYGRAFCWESEPMVWAIAKYMVKSLFISGHPVVILDACSLTQARRSEWANDDWTTLIHRVPTPAEICVERAVAAGRTELLEVIDKFDRGFQPPELDIRTWEYV